MSILTDKEVKDLLDSLKIKGVAIKKDNNTYTLDLENSDELFKCMTKIENAKDNEDNLRFEKEDETSNITEDTINLHYTNEDNNEDVNKYSLTLFGDLEGDTYKLVIDKEY